MDTEAQRRDGVEAAAVEMQLSATEGNNEPSRVVADQASGQDVPAERRASLPTHLLKASGLPSPYPAQRRRSAVAAMQTTVSRAVATLSPTTNEFYLTFGPLGVPMVVAFLSSAVTLFAMAFVQVFPTQVANFLMKTSDLDQGEFWLLTKPPRVLVVMATLMLAVFGCCYAALAYAMVFSRKLLLRRPARQPAPKEIGKRSSNQTKTSQTPSIDEPKSGFQELLHVLTTAMQRVQPSKPPSRRVGNGTPRLPPRRPTLMYELTSHDGVYHAYYNALFDWPKLAFQTAALGTYLTEGFPLPLIYFYVTLLMTNWLISFYRFQRQAADHNLVITRLFYLFDLFFAVFAPIVVILYAYSHFVLDREIFAIRERTLSPGMFDRIARLFADPVEVDVFRYAFQHLQLTKTWYVACKGCLNVLGVYKWKKIIAYLVSQRAVASPVLASPSEPIATQSRQEEQPQRPRDWRATIKCVVRVHGKRRHLIFGIAVFLSSMAAIPTYVSVSITSSLKNCESIPQCRVVSYRWLTGEEECPCIVFIDRDQSPTTFNAWINSPNATEPLMLAAKSGHLKTLQIINRAVVTLPVELRNCVELEQLILVYTKTQELPDWVGEFHDLHYVHVESDFINFPLHTLPLDMFAHTPKLRFIRFGGAAKLHVFPSLRGLHELTSLVLSIPHELTELPDLADLHSLKTLIIADATHVKRLPSLQPLKALTTFSLFRRNAVCCNGFLTTVCDLTTYQCMPRANEDRVTCEDARIPQEDVDLLHRINAFVCTANLTSDVSDSEPTVYSTDTLCGGVRFKQCQLGGRGGMCYNGRMQIIHCDVFGEYEAMRRLEIAEGVGSACDPEVEAWMGCIRSR